MRKQYIEVPPVPLDCGLIRRIWQRVLGIFLMPFYVMAAWLLGAPGIGLRLKITFLALRLFIIGRISVTTCYSLISWPMDSTRYFEFPEVLNALLDVRVSKYLDIASPRLLPLLLLLKNPAATADLINPDPTDIKETEQFVAALKLQNRCTLHNSTIKNAKLNPQSFDLVTCISVLEHIPADTEAVEIMWSLVRPGGRLVLTLPCMAKPFEQYISHYNYGVLSPGDDGYTFWQRYYDDERLRSAIFSVTGTPAKMSVYGERRYGLFFRNASAKRLLGKLYPFWREPYMMAREYRYFKDVSELPGEGVVMLEFVKP